MKTSTLRNIIKEEISKILSEDIDDMGYEHVIGTDNEGKFYEASAIINMRDEIESINDIEEMSEDDYNELA